MFEKTKKPGFTAGNSKNTSILNQGNENINLKKKKPFEINQQPVSERNTIKNKRSLSQLENLKPFIFKSSENSSFNKSSSRRSLNYNASLDRDFPEDNFDNTFRNMFSHFSKLTEIMSNSNQMDSDSYRQKSRKINKSNLAVSGIKKVDIYEPLSDSQKMRYLDEIDRGSEQRMRAYNTIFNTIKNQISSITQKEDEEVIEKNLLNSLKINNKELIIENISKTVENNTLDFNDKNFNIINNNITVNIISNHHNVAEIEGINTIFPSGSKEKSNPRMNKGSSNCNANLTFNEDIEEENKNNDKNVVVPSHSFKNKTDLEFHSPYTFKKLKSNKKKSSFDLDSDDIDKLNKK
jgi:hypothetical protein